MATIEQPAINGVELPPAGTWTFDKAHTSVEFVARHMLTKVRGRFERFDGSVRIGERPQESSVHVEIDTSSITTGNEQRDGHLKSNDFFALDEHPALVFESTGIRPKEGRSFDLDGTLTVNGISNPVTLEAEFLGVGPGLHGATVAAFTAKTTIDREDWDMTWNMVLETGGFLVSKRVDIEIETELQLAG
jgi:polyisoprenoid-binding protein YceI